jgi:hypothetical protein
MAGSAMVQTQDVVGNYVKIILDWLSDASAGNGTFLLTGVWSGKIKSIMIGSDAGGTAPTNLYDLTLTNALGADVMAGGGANIAVPGTKVLAESSVPVLVNDTLTLNLSNAGNAKGGIVWIFLERQ